MLQVGSKEPKDSLNKRQSSVAYELPCGSYRGLSGPLSLGSVEAIKCNALSNSGYAIKICYGYVGHDSESVRHHLLAKKGSNEQVEGQRHTHCFH